MSFFSDLFNNKPVHYRTKKGIRVYDWHKTAERNGFSRSFSELFITILKEMIADRVTTAIVDSGYRETVNDLRNELRLRNDSFVELEWELHWELPCNFVRIKIDDKDYDICLLEEFCFDQDMSSLQAIFELREGARAVKIEFSL